MNPIKRFVAPMALVALVAVAALWPATAMAAPTPWSLVEVAVHSERSGGVVIVTGSLPEGTSLPAEAELSVPKGTELAWIGQILGGAPADDPTLKYTKTTVGEADVYRFTMTESLIAQLEMPVATAAAFNGTDYDVALKWVSSQDLAEVRLMAQIPQPATIVRVSEGAVVQPVTANAAYYTKSFTDVKAGDALDLAFGYSVPAGAPGTVTPGATSPAAPTDMQPAASAPFDPAIPVVAAVLLVGVFAIGYTVAVHRRGGQIPTPSSIVEPDDDPYDDGDDDEFEVDSEGEDDDELEVDSEGDGEAADEAEPSGSRGSSGLSARLLIGVATVAVVIVIGVLVGGNSTKPQVENGTITQTFDGGSPCARVVVPVDAEAAGGPEEAAAAVFAALDAATGINEATYIIDSSSIDVGYCSTSTTEAAVREALATSGIIAQ